MLNRFSLKKFEKANSGLSSMARAEAGLKLKKSGPVWALALKMTQNWISLFFVYLKTDLLPAEPILTILAKTSNVRWLKCVAINVTIG